MNPGAAERGTVANPIPPEERNRPLRAADIMYHPERWPNPKGQRMVMTQDWEFTHDVYPNEPKIIGKQGVEFFVDTYVPAEASSSGFAFYWGVGAETEVGLLCPAEYCEAVS